jgi:hypothetical protein
MPKGFPKNVLELSDAGYDWLNAGTCRGCGAAIQWYATPNREPDGRRKRIPIRVLDDKTIVAEFAVCPARKAFQRANRAHAKRADKNPRPIQGNLLPE